MTSVDRKAGNRDLVPLSEPQRMTLIEAREAFNAFLTIDPDSIQSEKDLLAFYRFSDALTIITADILTRGNFSVTSSNHYLTSCEENSGNIHLLSVTYPIKNALYSIGFNASPENILGYIAHTTPADIQLSTANDEITRFLFNHRIQPTYEGEREPQGVSAITYDQEGKRQQSVNIWPGNKLLEATDYQFGARAIQQSVGILLRWSESIAA